MKAIILIAGTTGWYEETYRLAKRAIKNTDTRITSNVKKVQNLMKGALEKVLIINGSRGFSTLETYHAIKNTKSKNKIKITVLDSWKWPLNKPDKMILLPTKSLIETIQNEL
jgi:tyrosyl-tRNA synthetase